MLGISWRAGAVLVSAVALVGCGSSSAEDEEPASTAKAAATVTVTATATPEERHVITAVYDEPRTDADATAKQILELGGTTGIAEGFSTSFRLPVDLKIHAKAGNGSPFYDPDTRTVTLYYGFVNTTAKIIKAGQPGIPDRELGKQWAAVDDFILIHELGHAFVDVFEIPITGREEDAVDGMATVFFTDFVDGGAEYAFDAARFFAFLQDVQGEPDADQFQDEHSLSVQRAYDIACAVAGSSEDTMQQIAQLGILSDARLTRCPAEYEQKHRAWTQLLKPFAVSDS